MAALTPLRRQYLDIKKRYPDAILFFRLGDFYEMFEDDAILASEILQIVLTGRELGKGARVPMCGVPYHAAETYATRLLDAGQQGWPSATRSARPAAASSSARSPRSSPPGLGWEDGMLRPEHNNYLAAVVCDRRAARARLRRHHHRRIRRHLIWRRRPAGPTTAGNRPP